MHKTLKYLVATLALAFACLPNTTQAQVTTRPPTVFTENQAQQAIVSRKGWIRVCVGNAKSGTIQVPGGFKALADGYASGSGSGAVTVSCSGKTVTASQGGKPIAKGGEITIVPNSAHGLIGIGSNNYRGKFVAVANGGSLALINEVMVDDFLKGMLDAEIGADSPPEALKAQAICARSELIRKLIKPPHRVNGYDFCTAVHCMVYKGVGAETPACRDAVDQTNGLVLITEGNVLDAVFHNVCGGTTAGAEEVWDSKPVPGLVPIIDDGRGRSAPDLSSDRAAAAFIANNSSKLCCHPDNPGYPNYAKKYFRWEKSLSLDAIGRASGVGTARDVRVVQRTASGRVRKLEIVGARGSKIIEKELPIRNALGLWSGFFVVNVSGGQATFRGAGNGHGVGLCQMGARTMAASGAKYNNILANYYPKATIKRIYKP